jgi:hypothetical protein
MSSDPVRCYRGIDSRPAAGSPPSSAAGPASGPEFASRHAYRAPGTTLRRGFRGARSGADFARTEPLSPLLRQRPGRQRPQVTLCASAPASPAARTTDLRVAQAQRARSRAFWPTGSKSLLADESVFAGGQLSDPAILQILVRLHGSCTSVELSSYAAERVVNYTLASTRGSVGVSSRWVFQPCKEIARCSSMR